MRRTWTEDDVFGILDPPPERACAHFFVSAPLSPLLAACRTRARRLPLVVSFRGASSHTSRSRARRAPRSPPRPRLVGAPRSRARNLPYAAVTPPSRGRARWGRSNRGSARDRRLGARVLLPDTVARRLTPHASPLRSQTRARGGRAEAYPVGKHGRVRWSFDTTKVWSPAGGWFADPVWKRNTMLGFVLGVAAPPSSTTAGRWSRGRSRPPAGSPARRGANFPEGSPANRGLAQTRTKTRTSRNEW